MFGSFHRKKEPGTRAPDEARRVIAERLRDPGLTSLERGLLKTIAAWCAPKITPSPLSDHRHQQMRDRS